jgi:hypothetical protein
MYVPASPWVRSMRSSMNCDCVLYAIFVVVTAHCNREDHQNAEEDALYEVRIWYTKCNGLLYHPDAQGDSSLGMTGIWSPNSVQARA